VARQALGCDQVQGYWIGKPMTAGDLESWLATAPWAGAKITCG
jgi:EAL domain-containing protein (putative c-di-GMP-specific phosphodiesterase class I)